MMKQLDLFDPEPPDQTLAAERGGSIECSSASLLDLFRQQRLAEGAHPRSVARELSQLRSLARESQQSGGPSELSELFTNLSVTARVLCEPSTPIAGSTGRARLIAAQRFIRIFGDVASYDVDDRLSQLDALLPGTRVTNWHRAGTLVAGSRSRQRRRGPTLDAQDLHRIVYAAGRSGEKNNTRNCTLVALHCFSGLRPEEIVALDWKQVDVDHEGDGHIALCVSIERLGRPLRLPLPRQAGSALVDLASETGNTVETMVGPVFRARATSSTPMTYRAARDVLTRACRGAGLPAVGAVELRAAYARWLESIGMSDHEITTILGLQRVRSVDRLLARHRAIDAQRQVREMIDL